MSEPVRRGNAADAGACAAILNAWIDTTDWMPRVHEPADVARHYRDTVLREREVWVIGDPVDGYIAIAAGAGEVTSLYAAHPGRGHGKRLLDHAKTRHRALDLWTFVANMRARRFYQREGFREVRRTDGDNEEGLRDVLYRWEAA